MDNDEVLHWLSRCFTLLLMCINQELKAQCFGGEYTGEVYDHVMRRCVCMCVFDGLNIWCTNTLEHSIDDRKDGGVLTSYFMNVSAKTQQKLQVSTINACAINNHLSIVVAEEPEYSVPCPIRKAVQKQNLEFLHHKAHFNLPYFQFIKQLLNVNAQCLHQCMEQNKKLTVSLSSSFLLSR